MATLEGLGNSCLWGFSPSMNLLDYAATPAKETENRPGNENDSRLSVLIAGAGDVRHIIRTVAERAKSNRKLAIDFYIYESQAPIYCRQILQIHMLASHCQELWDGEDMTLEERANLFLEVYGNSRLRESTQRYLEKTYSSVVKAVTGDSKGASHPVKKLFDLSLLKFRERDDLEFTFNFWADSGKRRQFDLPLLWDLRMRRFYGARYDCVDNVSDWDYHMKLGKQAPIVRKQEFMEWRRTGIAFKVREFDYPCVNRTFATVSLMTENGLKVPKWGYFSDICQSPFLTFGVESENKDLLKTCNDVHLHSSRDVSQYNIMAYLQELETGRVYSPTALTDTNESLISGMAWKDISITLMPADAFTSLETLENQICTSKTRRWLQKFDLVWVASSLAHMAEKISRAGWLKPAKDPRIIVESVKYIIDLKDDQKEKFEEKFKAELGFIVPN